MAVFMEMASTIPENWGNWILRQGTQVAVDGSGNSVVLYADQDDMAHLAVRDATASNRKGLFIKPLITAVTD